MSIIHVAIIEWMKASLCDPPGRLSSHQLDKEDDIVNLQLVTVAPQGKVGIIEQPLPELDVGLRNGKIGPGQVAGRHNIYPTP